MEAFAPLPVDLFADPNALLDDDPSTYFSLSQFDLELQQQAQAALFQQDSWQDFDKYLPLDNQLFNNTATLRNDQQAQPIFMNNNNNNYNTNPSLLYEPLSDLLPYQQQVKPVFDINSTAPNWDNNDGINIKQEYASPESMPYSPPQNTQANLPSSPQQTASQKQDMPLFQQQSNSNTASPTTETKSSPTTSILTTPGIDFTNWNSPSLGTTNPPDSVSQQGKVPIQRLKSNSIINNAVNAALNNTNAPVGRQHKKTAHNAIERRYRNNINDRIAELKNAVPALLYAKVKDNRAGGKRSHEDEDEVEDGEEFLDGVAVATKLNKATILRKATEYINHLKKTGDDTRRENQALQHILTQLPGGQDILQRYHLQKQQREKEMHQQQLIERELQKQQEQKRKVANRKRARLNNNSHSDEYESSSSSPDPVTPPAMTNRVFMALFMAITFFSTSPLTAGPSSSAQYQNHHHSSRTTSSGAGDDGSTDPISQNLDNTNASPNTFLNSLFNFNDTWSSLRTIIFIICVAQLFFPYIKAMIFGSSLKLKRVSRSKRMVGSSPRKEITNSAMTPGDLKCRQIYSILEKSVSNQDQDMPHSITSTLFPLFKETARIFSHHVLGYDIMYDNHENMTPEEDWAQVCKWIKLNETRCVGGANNCSRVSMLYSCFRMINLIDTLDEDSHEHVIQTHARAYATAAMQMPLIIPHRALADKLSDYFWQLAISHHDDDDEQHVEESNLWMQSLAWMDPEQDHDSIQDMRYTRAWSEAIEILQNKTSDVTAHSLSLSYTAPVIVPVAILSTLHLLDNLRIQFDRLIGIMSRKDGDNSKKMDESLETAFLDIMLLTEPVQDQSEDSTSTDQQRLAHWLAAVGATVQALWKNNSEQAEKWLPTLIQRVPRSMTCKVGTVSQKASWNKLDEALKKTMIHVLVGALLLRNSDVEKQKQGLVELENAEVLRENVIRKLQSKLRINNNENDCDLESSVMTLADFVVSFTGLEAWTMAMKLEVSNEKEVQINSEVHRISVALRNMTRPLQEADKSSMVSRLSHLSQFITQNEVDSACDLSDAEDIVSIEHEALSNHQILVKKADRAQLILHGVA